MSNNSDIDPKFYILMNAQFVVEPAKEHKQTGTKMNSVKAIIQTQDTLERKSDRSLTELLEGPYLL